MTKFVFAVIDHEEGPMVYVSEESYWKANGFLQDSYLSEDEDGEEDYAVMDELNELTAKHGLGEIAESMYLQNDPTLTVEELKAKLSADESFIYDAAFEAFLTN